MIIKTLNRAESETAMREWIAMYPELPEIEAEYYKIRENIQNFNSKVRTKCQKEITRKDYYTDVHLGLYLYKYLEDIPEFNLRAAANDDFWRYLSLKVVPDVVAERWGKDNESHYWSKPSRIWLRSIWWYVHLSWQGDILSTERVLESPYFSTDTIINLEERTGRKGTFINVYRYIMYFYSQLSKNELERYYREKTNVKQGDLFRTIMKLNTAKVMVMEPALFLGGEKEYARSLFIDAGVRI